MTRAAKGLASKLQGSRPLSNAACGHLAAVRLGQPSTRVCQALQDEKRGPLLEQRRMAGNHML